MFRRKEAQQKHFSICLQIIHLEFEEIFEIVIKNFKVGKGEKWGGLLGQISDNDRDSSLRMSRMWLFLFGKKLVSCHFLVTMKSLHPRLFLETITPVNFIFLPPQYSLQSKFQLQCLIVPSAGLSSSFHVERTIHRSFS